MKSSTYRFFRSLLQGSLLVVVVVLLLLLQPNTCNAQIACNASYNPCEELLYRGSECRNGFCSNPFEKGCLTTVLHEEFGDEVGVGGKESLLPSLARRIRNQIRVCNSEDPPDAVTRGACADHTTLEHSLFDEYTEVRILSQNWESAFFSSWLMQILLSEILQVPTSIESGKADVKLNFYSATNEFGYGRSSVFEALEAATAAPNGDCTLIGETTTTPTTAAPTAEGDDGYTACGHVLLETWGDGRDLWKKHREGTLDVPVGLGAIGAQALFVPKFTAQADSTVLNLLGIAGESNRRKLAEMFLRPTTWGDYCALVSITRCAVPDNVAQRPPTEEEVDKMHAPNLYTGYFRATEENDCDRYPTNCTGHVADYPCGWGSYVGPQTYFHNIALKSSGKEPGSHGYTYSQLVEMYQAANETKSHLMTMWWMPEAMYSSYLGTEAEMLKVILPSPTEECRKHRIKPSQRCEFNSPEEQYGDELGACDEAPQLLQKVVSSGLYKNTYDAGIAEAKQSPAYEVVKAFQIDELQLGAILQRWIRRDIDRYGFDPRFATCMWLRDNLNYIENFIPRNYPRVGQKQNALQSPVFYAAIVFGVLATVMTVVTTVLTYRRRNGYVMRFSQVEFLLLLLLGLLLVSLGSILLAIPPRNWSCITITWLVGLGYTLELVPLIVKVGALARMMTAAKRYKRLVLSQQQLFGTVAFFTGIIVVFLILWSALDPPTREGEFTLTDDTTEDGEYIVTVGYFCSSQSDVWRYLAVVWHCILLICATVLAFQTRNLQAGFSESHVLAIMIYSHFVFVIFRVFSFLLEDSLSEPYMAGVLSLIYSIDVVVTLCVYFVPKLLQDDSKFYALTHPPGASKTGRGSVLTNGPSIAMKNSSALNSKPFESPFNSKLSERDSDDNSAGDPTPGGALVKTSIRTSRSNNKTKEGNGSVKDKVSWADLNLSEWVSNGIQDFDEDSKGSSEESDCGEDESKENEPFQKPVDVLKGNRDSWGGAHLTLVIQEDDEKSSNNGADTGRLGALTPIVESNSESNQLESPVKPKGKTLSQSNLPEPESSRFNELASRINSVRFRHTSSQPDDDDSFVDETIAMK